MESILTKIKTILLILSIFILGYGFEADTTRDTCICYHIMDGKN